MAILMIHDASNDTLANYEEGLKQLEAAGQGQPQGRLFHLAVNKGTGFMVMDLWDSQEDVDRFAQTLIPILQQVGTQISEPERYTVHDLIMGKK